MTSIISASQIITIAFEDKTFYANYILPDIILECQEANLKPDLGKEYYAELLSQFTANDSTYTTANRFIVENFLQKAIAWFVKAKIIPAIAAKLSNAGMLQMKGQTELVASSSSIPQVQENCIESAKFWLNAALEYMEDDSNKSNYLTYNNNRMQDQAGTENSNRISGWINL